MKFTCERDVLAKEIGFAQEVITSRSNVSILSNVFLHAENKTLTIRATDLKVSFETQIPVEVSASGSTTVLCDKLLGILKSLPSGEIEFDQSEGSDFVIRPLFKKIDFRLRSIESDKYPEIQLASEDQYFEVSQAAFIEMISQTIFAVSDDETRYFMNGVYMEQSDDELVMVATDGRRLSYIHKTPDAPLKEFEGVIIPPKVLHMTRKLASGEGTFFLAVNEKNVFFQFDNRKISSALIEGQFPNYRRVIPDEQEHRLTINREELIEALRRVSLLVEKSRRVYVTLSDGSMTLTSEETEVGVAHEELACDYEGPENRIALNYVYLMDPLRVMNTEEVAIQFSEPNRAISINAVPEREYFHIVMPMQLD
jgi:DNA polymerase-3 subunit beta